jgi:hypothetical protein
MAIQFSRASTGQVSSLVPTTIWISLPFLVGLGTRDADGVAAAMFGQVFDAQGGHF